MDTKRKNEEFEEKICKKIGQLTRVIFYMNVRNEEYESLTKQMVRDHQSQLDSAVQRANELIEEESGKRDLHEKVKDLESILSQLEAKTQRDLIENGKLVKALEKQIDKKKSPEQKTEAIEAQTKRLEDLAIELERIQEEFKNNEELFETKMRMKEEQFEKYTQKNNQKYSK